MFEAGAAFVVALDDVAGVVRRVRVHEHLVLGPGVRLPAREGLQVHRGELPTAQRVLGPAPEPLLLDRVADGEPVLAQQDPLLHQHPLEDRALVQEALVLGRAAVALQQRLLPAATTDTPAAETVGFYVLAGGGAEIGGDWYDVIALPSFRVALVAGDVTGHGLPATATMGRLRTAVDTLADLELDPDELLTHLDDLVQQLQTEAPHQGDTIGASCLYAVYDPVTCQCTLASAGHPPPLVIRPDGTVESVEVSPGPLLGVGGLPFEATTFDLEPGSIVAVYTKGVIYREDHDPDAGLRRLTDRLARFAGPGRGLDGAGHEFLRSLGDAPARDDMALLLARTRAIDPGNTATWEFPADASVVAAARKAAAGLLAAWGLDEVSFITELVVSELVTNAVRYAGGPIGMRLIRGDVLVCEVNDPSNTQPRLRRARWSDEGGRGLFLIAQLTTRWGSRYTRSGKTIWTEQPLTAEFDLLDLPS